MGGRHRAAARHRAPGSVLWAVTVAVTAVALGSIPSAAPVAAQPAVPPATEPRAGPASARIVPVLSDVRQSVGATPAAATEEPGRGVAELATGDPDDRAAVAVRVALAQVGMPYVWGGDGPTAGHAGFDCSGLTTHAYGRAGIRLPRTAHTQYHRGPHVPAGASLRPGDLVFYGTVGRVHHVGMYLGEGRMVAAPTFGKPVQVAYHRWPGDRFLGATRPAASGERSRGVLPRPVPGPPPAPPRVFEAPPAPMPEIPLALRRGPAGATDAPRSGGPGSAPEHGRDADVVTPDPSAVEPQGADPSEVDPPNVDPTVVDPPGADPPGADPPAPDAPTPRSAPSAPVPSPIGPASPGSPAPPAEIDLPGGAVTLTPAPLVAGLPAASDQGGAVSVSAGNVAIRLASPEQLTGLAPGSVIVLRTADGAATRYTVSDVTTVGSSAAAELVAAAPLVVLAQTAPDEWLTISAA